MTVSMSAPGTVRFGTLLTYNVRVSNNGPSPATGVRATLSLPFLLTLQSSGFCTGGFGTFQCDFGTLAPGGSATVSILVIVLQLGTITASGSVSANQPDPVPGNNNASATTDVTLFLREKEETLVAVTTHLDVARGDGRSRGEIVLGSRHFGIDSTAPVELLYRLVVALSPRPRRSRGKRRRSRAGLRKRSCRNVAFRLPRHEGHGGRNDRRRRGQGHSTRAAGRRIPSSRRSGGENPIPLPRHGALISTRTEFRTFGRGARTGWTVEGGARSACEGA